MTPIGRSTIRDRHFRLHAHSGAELPTRKKPLVRQQFIHDEINASRSALHGDYVSATRVTDTLLDLRSLAAEAPALVALIDDTLASMPGRSVVPNQWWVEALDAIEQLDGEIGEVEPLDVVTS